MLPFHLIIVNRPAPVNVVHFEGPRQLLLRGSVRSNMKSQHELPEVNSPTVVRVKCSEHILAELGGVAPREHLAVHGDKLLLCQFSRGTILQETLVPGLRLDTKIIKGIAQDIWIYS